MPNVSQPLESRGAGECAREVRLSSGVKVRVLT